MTTFPTQRATIPYIYALDAPVRKASDTPPSVFPSARVLLSNRERAAYLSEFSRAVGGEVRLNRKHHTAGLQLFAGSRVPRTHACTALLDTGAQHPSSKRRHGCVWCCVGRWVNTVAQKTWAGFHGVPLVTSSRVRLDIHLASSGKHGRQPTPPSNVCMVAHAHVVLDTAMSTAILLGRDSWSHFPLRKRYQRQRNDLNLC